MAYFDSFDSPHIHDNGNMTRSIMDDNSGAPPPPPLNFDPGPSGSPTSTDTNTWDFSNDPTSGGNNGGGSWTDIFSNLFGGNGNFAGLDPNMASKAALFAGAWNDWNNSDKYMDMAGKYSDQMDPFGKQRGYYQDRLKQLTQDPNAYLANSPDYQASKQQGLDTLDRVNAGKGTFGTGSGNADAIRFASQLASQYLDKDRQSLMNMAGSGIGPSAAEDLIKTGITGSINSRNNAMTNLFRGLFPNTTTNNNVNNPNGKTNNSSDPNGALRTQLKNAGMTDQEINDLLGGPPDASGGGGGDFTNGDWPSGQYDKNGNWVGGPGNDSSVSNFWDWWNSQGWSDGSGGAAP